ncbi:MAG: UbiD family decarboxylase [Polyangiaceae bacterium]|nr:UbiD family decarboxylase [Polyangiaceae bacterium]
MKDLAGFIAEQERLGRVVHVQEEVDPVREAGAAIAAQEGRIVVLDRVRGASGRVAGGVASSRELVAAAIGCGPSETAQVLARAMDAPRPVVPVAEAPFLRSSPVFQVEEAFAQLVFDPGAERPYLSASVIAARSRRYGMNLSFHRMMYLGQNRFSVRIVPRHLAMILEESAGTAEIAVLLGLHPAVSLAAACSGPPELDELELASALVGGLSTVELDGLTVPAGAEIVLRGTLSAKELAEEGPFVDLTGTLDGVRQQPTFTVSRILRRAEAILQAVVPGGKEHQLLMGTPQEPRIHRAVANTVPCLHRVALTRGGCNWLHAAVALDNPRPGQARNAGMAALGAHPSLKRVVVVDADVNIYDTDALEWAIATRVQADRDVIIIPGCRGSSLDPSRSDQDDTTAKWIIDATMPPGRDRAEFVRAGPGRGSGVS